GGRVGNAVLLVGLHLVRHAIEEPSHTQHVGVVDRHTPLEVAPGEETVRPEAASPHGPELVLFGLALEDAPVREAVLELLEADLQMRWRPTSVGTAEGARPVRVQPLEVHGIDRVLLVLEPVAGNLGEDDLHEAVLPRERLPGRHQRRGRRPEVGPEEPGLRFDRVVLDANAVLEPSIRMGRFLEWLLKAPARVIPEPAVVVAAEPAVLDPAVGEIGAPVRAGTIDEAVVPGAILVEDEILAHEAYGLGGPVVQLRDGGDRHPVPPQKLTHGGARADFGQSPVLILAEHAPILPPVTV